MTGLSVVEAEINAIASRFGELKAIKRLEKIGQQVQPKAPSLPHHEIFWLAILPEARGKGIGSRLLKPVLGNADAEKVGCYLVSSNPRNIPFYQRHGFNQSSLIPISTLTLVGMWRAPHCNSPTPLQTNF